MKNLQKYAQQCISDLNAIGIYPNEIERFSVNTRARNRWGQAQYREGKYYINISVLLLDEQCPDSALRNTLYHELLHCCNRCMNHGEEWSRLAQIVSDCYGLDIKRCASDEEKLGAEYANKIKAEEPLKQKKEFKIRCTKCGKVVTLRRYRTPKCVMHPQSYTHTNCGGHFENYA